MRYEQISAKRLALDSHLFRPLYTYQSFFISSSLFFVKVVNNLHLIKCEGAGAQGTNHLEDTELEGDRNQQGSVYVPTPV